MLGNCVNKIPKSSKPFQEGMRSINCFTPDRAWQEAATIQQALKRTSADIFTNSSRPSMGYSVSMEEPETPHSWEGHRPWEDPFPRPSLEEGRETEEHLPLPWGGHQQLLGERHRTQPTSPADSINPPPHLGTRYSPLAL